MMSSLMLAMPLVSLALVAAPAARAVVPPPVAPRSTVVSPVAADGWKFHWKVTVESDRKDKERVPVQPSMQVSLIPGKVRIDYEGNAQPQGMMKKGGYMILDAEKSEMIMVDPQDKKAIVMDPTAIGNAMGAIGASGLVKMDVKDVKVSTEKLGSGERMLGYATTRYRITRAYTMTVSVFGRKNSTTHNSVTEAWIADRFFEDKAFEAWAQSFTRGMGNATGEGFKKLMEAEQANQVKGVPLKQVQQITDTDEKGNVTTSTVTAEMTELSKASLDASLFEVPKGYEVTDMKAQMAAMGDSLKVAKEKCEKEKGKGNCEMPSLDSAMKAGAKDGAKESAADAAKKKLRGFFKKP